MKSIKTLIFALAIGAVTMSCSGDKKKGIDYNQFKTEVKLTPEQEKSFDEITKNIRIFKSRTFRQQKLKAEIWTE
ncbi:hypothetical protein [Chryseobacterium sp. MEBOG07]|uniref:hypothetical protein n=1 Tax=Chryseobacterium sp. MEBOG07 TaxID=2879939 RepID=UPI001F1E28AA|nr:hypothetical protein [Chryseobacterium sp. MEBOG07]UKB79239.1 hypothetical protein LF886_22890 [Chryseobacterium sp. MEBOG07]